MTEVQITDKDVWKVRPEADGSYTNLGRQGRGGRPIRQLGRYPGPSCDGVGREPQAAERDMLAAGLGKDGNRMKVKAKDLVVGDRFLWRSRKFTKAPQYYYFFRLSNSPTYVYGFPDDGDGTNESLVSFEPDTEVVLISDEDMASLSILVAEASA